MEEIWKRIPGYEDYEVSNIGRIISYKQKQPKLLNGWNNNGYLMYGLCDGNKQFNCGAHVAVAMAFLNHKPCGWELVIDHINNIPSDNRVENLQIVTTRFNTRKIQGLGTSKYKGVCWNKECSKWQSAIRVKGKSKHLGMFTDEYEAHLAYEKALKELL